MKCVNVQSIGCRVQRSRGWVSLRLGDLWEYRELLYFLTWRDVKVRYKQTVLGAAWAILQPLLTMLVFSLFFGRLAHMPSGRRAVSDLHLRGARAVDVLRERPHAVVEQPGRQREPDHEGLFPAARSCRSPRCCPA